MNCYSFWGFVFPIVQKFGLLQLLMQSTCKYSYQISVLFSQATELPPQHSFGHKLMVCVTLATEFACTITGAWVYKYSHCFRINM
jgi:hypothetical protein